MKKIISENLFLALCIPIFLNFCINMLQNNESLFHFYIKNFHHLFSLVLACVFFYIITYEINNLLNVNSLSLSLAYFLSSFFLVEYISISFGIKIFNNINVFHYLTLLFWLIIFVSKKIKLQNLFTIIASYTGLIIYNFYNFETIRTVLNYKELNTDVENQWFQITQKIHSEGLFEAFINNIIQGQGLYISHIQSTIFKINFPLKDFEYIRVNSNIFLFFALFLFFDLQIKFKNKIILSLLYFCVVLNSDWLTYLFVDSLMLEGIVGLIFCSFLVNLEKFQNRKINLNSIIFFLFFGCLLLSKQFISLIVLLFVIYLLFVKKYLNAFSSLFIYILDKLYLKIFFENNVSFEYLDGRSVLGLIVDLITLNNLDISVVQKIIYELLKDRIVSYLFIIFVLLNLYSIILGKDTKNLFYLVLINILLIAILYISWWKNIEVQSSYRYFLNFFYVLISSIALNIDQLFKED